MILRTKLTKYNAFDDIESDGEILEFLTECFKDDDPKTFTTALAHLVEKKGVSEVARLTGLNRESLYKTVNGKTAPSFATVHKILHSLNITPSFSYA